MPYREGLSGQYSAGGYAGKEAAFVYRLEQDTCGFLLFYEVHYMVLAVDVIKLFRVVLRKFI